MCEVRGVKLTGVFIDLVSARNQQVSFHLILNSVDGVTTILLRDVSIRLKLR